jgi:thiamine kinase-like enzyme
MSCNTRNPSPPCSPGKAPRTRTLPSGKQETCCYSAKKEIKKAQKAAEKSCNARNPSPPCSPGKAPRTRTLPSGKQETCCYSAKKEIKKVQKAAEKSCNARNPSPPCSPGKAPRTRTLPSGKQETCCYSAKKEIKKAQKAAEKSCNTRNPSPPCSPGKAPRTRTLPSGKQETCCYSAKKEIKKAQKKRTQKKPPNVLNMNIPKKTNITKKIIKNRIKTNKIKTRRNRILEKIVTKFDKSNQLIKRLKYSYPLKDIEDIADSKTHKISLGVLKGLIVKTQREDKPPKSIKTLNTIASGSFNTVYNDGSDKAWRINSQIIYDENEVEEMYREGLLTIRLAGLDIAPKIYDYYFAKYFVKYNNRNHAGFYCVQVSEYSKYGSLANFMRKPQFVNETIIKMAKETIQLYKRMGDNEIFCIDVKPGNMIVTNNLSVRIIDFDTGFCASKESDTNRKLSTFLKELKVKIPTITASQIKNGFLTFNLLQVAAISKIYSDNSNTDLFAKLLVRNITSKDIQDALNVANLNVGSKKPIDTIVWYTSQNNGIRNSFFYLGENTLVSNDPKTVMGLLYLSIKFGIKKTNQILFEYTKKKIKKYSDRLTISLNEKHEEGHIFYAYSQNGSKYNTRTPPNFYHPVFSLDSAEKDGLIPK